MNLGFPKKGQIGEGQIRSLSEINCLERRINNLQMIAHL